MGCELTTRALPHIESDQVPQPVVSIITAFWNAGRFIDDAISSVLGQTFQNWELLLVDDGSSDGSTDIALRYAAMQPRRICYLTHPERENRGTCASRNLGIRNGTAKYICILD